MIKREHNGAIVAGATREDVNRFIANDDKIRAGLCPNGCGFMCNTVRDDER